MAPDTFLRRALSFDRLIIWRFALPGPRIVHLSRKNVDEGDDDYGAFEFEEDDVNYIEYQLAKERLLTRDDMFEGTMTRDDAERIICRERIMPEPLQPGRNCPDTFYGYFSESETPALLLACKESQSVASKVYTRAFSLPGFLPHTYFDFHVDPLYLTSLTVPTLHCFRVSRRSTNAFKQGFVLSDLARVKHLAIEWDQCVLHPHDREASIVARWIYAIHQLFPNLKSFTIVSEQYTHRLGHIYFGSSPTRISEDYRNLKWVSTSKDPSTNESRINGCLIDPSLRQPYLYGTRPIIQPEVVDRAARLWDEKYPNCQWRFPNIEQKIMMNEADERQLLQEAFQIHKRFKNGCWYINPEDPTDFQECVDGGVEFDKDLARLLDG